MKPGVIPYSVNAPFWSDGAAQGAVPRAARTGTISYKRNRGWDFPDKTVLVKCFALEHEGGRPGEPQVDRDAVLDASRAASGSATVRVERRRHRRDARRRGGHGREFVKIDAGRRAEADVALPEPRRVHGLPQPGRELRARAVRVQMNKDHTYPNGRTDNQLRVLEHLGLLSVNWAGEAGAAKQQRPRPARRPKPTRAAARAAGGAEEARGPLRQDASRWTRGRRRGCTRTARRATSRPAAGTRRWNWSSRPRGTRCG